MTRLGKIYVFFVGVKLVGRAEIILCIFNKFFEKY
jgi:hypothetical protein